MTAILIVEDSKPVNKLLVRMLSGEGYDIENCFSVDDALKLYKGTKFDVIITDLIMPDKDGVELLEYITTHTAPIDKPSLIAISGGSDDTVNASTALQSVEGLVDCVLKKPFPQAVLVKTVAGLLNKD